MYVAILLLFASSSVATRESRSHHSVLVERWVPQDWEQPAMNFSCPPWFLPGINDSCKCSSAIGRQIICSVRMRKIYVMMGYCMTWHSSGNMPILARCPFHYPNNYGIIDGYLPLSPEIQGENLTNNMCGHFHRTGELCNSCREGYGPAPFSNGMPCAQCQGSGYKWLYYLIFQLLLLTALFVVCALLMIQLTKSPFNVLVFYWQIFVVALNFDSMLYGYLTYYIKAGFVQVMISFYAIWNMEFFRYSIPPLCVTSSMSNANAILFDYIIALYPIVLTLVAYVCIELYDRNTRLVVYMWRPFLHCFTRCKKKWNPKASIVKTFATFLILAYTKLLFTSANLLYGTPVYDHDGKPVPPSYVLYYDSKITFFSKEHAPYVMVAVVILTLTLLPLLLLLLYPTKLFKKTLEKCGFRQWHLLNNFMDTFQGWYKDGTEGTRDYRWVSSLYFILRIGFVGQCLATTMSKNPNQLFWILPGVIFIATSVFFTTVRPYKVSWMNNIDGAVLAVLGINFFIFYQYYDDMVFIMAVVVATVPLLLCTLYGIYKLTKITNIYAKVLNQLKMVLRQHPRRNEGDLPDTMPYRITNPNSYQNSDNRQQELEEGYAYQSRAINTYGTCGSLQQ